MARTGTILPSALLSHMPEGQPSGLSTTSLQRNFVPTCHLPSRHYIPNRAYVNISQQMDTESCGMRHSALILILYRLINYLFALLHVYCLTANCVSFMVSRLQTQDVHQFFYHEAN